jgi:hypothetical protein
VYDSRALAEDMFRLHDVVFTRILLDMGLYVAEMVFAAGFAELIRREDQ